MEDRIAELEERLDIMMSAFVFKELGNSRYRFATLSKELSRFSIVIPTFYHFQ
jgi:hypothetical protein